ncbi:helix-turn-helix domain-containing protein [Bacillus sp. AFS040349]|uniref:helix-turn-helix domain-containing protein n=1 Tax=Bacillus sp. AFS040349 TaxID=2033502 RepID=UPI000BFCA013|nr:helix-turn-helix domain-containing protein [Bacillus sp. AFS040349]PGT83296.1 hypothetical protein COD11_13250 [Bacillus sp. AFS040349]
MTNHQEELISTNEAAKELDVTTHTIYKYIQDGKLEPVYKDKWQIDTTLLFKKEDIDRLAKIMKKPGLTTGDIAKELEIHPTTVASYIAKGLLKATKHPYKGREIYFVTLEDLDEFKQNNILQKKREKKQFYIKDKGYYLFQLLHNATTQEKARIMELQEDGGKVITENGQVYQLEDAETAGFEAIKEIEDKKYITKRGYAKFEFPKPQYINSPVYSVIELLYQHVGPKNLRLVSEVERIVIEVKPVLLNISTETHLTEIKLIETSCVDGSVTLRHNGLLIDSDIEPLVLHVPAQLKNEIKKNATKESITLEEAAIKFLREGLGRYGTNGPFR